MSDRDGVVQSVLEGTPWAAWRWSVIAGDASARRYLRLTSGDDSVIVMDAPPEICTDTPAFLAMATWLTRAKLAAPAILLQDLARGVLVLSDLGPTDFAGHLRGHPADESTLYAAATDLLVALTHQSPPDGFVHLTPDHGAAMIAPLGQHYVQGDITPLQTLLLDGLRDHATPPDTLALRDFHAENLIWRGDRQGIDRVGLLDFQDAFVAPAGYDLASLLRDARREVAPDTSRAMIAQFAKGTGRDTTEMATQIAVLGVQRNLRILGIFAKLARVDGKARYLDFMPRVWTHILADLSNPALASLRAAVLASVPAPDPAFLEGLTA